MDNTFLQVGVPLSDFTTSVRVLAMTSSDFPSEAIQLPTFSANRERSDWW